MPGERQSRRCMQSVTELRLFASPDERRLLFATMERYNAACNAASPVAFSEGQFSDRGLQARRYHRIRGTFGLSAQMTILALRKVAGSYRSTREAIKEQNKMLAALGKPQKSLTEISFREHGAICYDARVLSLGRNRVSIWTLDGRINLRCSRRSLNETAETLHNLLAGEAGLPDGRSQYPSPGFFSLMDNDTSSIRMLQNDVTAPLPGKNPYRLPGSTCVIQGQPPTGKTSYPLMAKSYHR